MTSFLNPSRRGFLQTTASAMASLLLPRSISARKPSKPFWFIKNDNGDSWPVADPVAWSLENAREPVLERASEGLLRLSPDDGDRIVRLVTRRCNLNLIELHPGQVVVHHWGQEGMADVRPFLKTHGLAHSEIEVVVIERKKEVVTTQAGDNFRYGDPLAANFPLDLYQSKWHSRSKNQPDDRTVAPGTWSGFAWEGVEDNRIPWTAMKSAWRRASPMLCLNCDQPTILVNFGFIRSRMSDSYPNFFHVCGACRRSFEDRSILSVGKWVVANLDAEVLPDFHMMWGRRVKWAVA